MSWLNDKLHELQKLAEDARVQDIGSSDNILSSIPTSVTDPVVEHPYASTIPLMFPGVVTAGARRAAALPLLRMLLAAGATRTAAGALRSPPVAIGTAVGGGLSIGLSGNHTVARWLNEMPVYRQYMQSPEADTESRVSGWDPRYSDQQEKQNVRRAIVRLHQQQQQQQLANAPSGATAAAPATTAPSNTRPSSDWQQQMLAKLREYAPGAGIGATVGGLTGAAAGRKGGNSLLLGGLGVVGGAAAGAAAQAYGPELYSILKKHLGS